MNRRVLLPIITLCFVLSFSAKGQAPTPALVGYFHNWQDASAPYVQLDQVDSRYNVIDVAFALPQSSTDYLMTFTPAMVSSATFINQIQTLHNQGRKVLISAGGATAPISLSNSMERDSFIATMSRIISTYHFDGMDIDFEGSSLSVSGGTINSPVDAPIINLIYAVKQIMSAFYTANGHHMILTTAPETAFVQGGMSSYGGIWGAYLPVIQALRDSIDILHVQLYNSGTMYGIDGHIYTQGTADFIVAGTEAAIRGFNTAGGTFLGLPSSKVAVGLPACSNASGGGYVSPVEVKAAIDYLRGTGPQPGIYTLAQSGGYSDLRGMMTWSINWDATATCGTSYEYAANYESIFGNTTSVENIAANDVKIYPNPAEENIFIEAKGFGDENVRIMLMNLLGATITDAFVSSKELTHYGFDTRSIPAGVYELILQSGSAKRSVKVIKL
jgi:chitinase